MGRPPSKSCVSEDQLSFSDRDFPRYAAARQVDFKSLEHPVWTEDKAKLIQSYLRLFTFITHHGNYIDGFAAPQYRNLVDLCSAYLVLKTEPKWIRNFWLCDIDPAGISTLEKIAEPERSKTRKVSIIRGDFNETIIDILKSDRITPTTATFALLDQRTFECEWETVKRIAAHKPSLGPCDTKIEIFYFLATGWLDRSIAAVRAPETSAKLDRWWGKSDWKNLRELQGIPRAKLLAKRFEEELGYKCARAFAIHNRRRHGRIMYHMIHATDHGEAPSLMLRAYRAVSGRSSIDSIIEQIDMENFWNEAEGN